MTIIPCPERVIIVKLMHRHFDKKLLYLMQDE